MKKGFCGENTAQNPFQNDIFDKFSTLFCVEISPLSPKQHYFGLNKVNLEFATEMPYYIKMGGLDNEQTATCILNMGYLQ